jgi:hypothetical protein
MFVPDCVLQCLWPVYGGAAGLGLRSGLNAGVCSVRGGSTLTGRQHEASVVACERGVCTHPLGGQIAEGVVVLPLGRILWRARHAILIQLVLVVQKLVGKIGH